MPVSVQSPVSRATGNGVTTVFPFHFQISAQGDLVVKVDDVLQTLTTHYSVAGVGLPAGGSVTFVTAPASGADVLIYRDTQLKRDTDYQENGDLLANTLDADVDRVWHKLQEFGLGVGRTLRAAIGETLSELPALAARSNTVLTFDASGQPQATPPADGSAVSLAMQLADDGGASLVGFLQQGAGAVARDVRSKLRESVSVKDFGAIGNGVVDDTTAIRAALAAATHIYFPPGKYRVTETLTISGARGLTIEGAASALMAGGTGYAGTSEIIFDDAASGTNGIVVTDFVGVSLCNLLIRMRRAGAGGGIALYLYNGHDYSIDGVRVDLHVGPTGVGVQLGGGSGATATFVGNVRNVKVIANDGTSIQANHGTSLHFQSCYAIGGWLRFDALTYSTVSSCASDAAPLYGYAVNGCSAMAFNACGAEACGKGAFYLSTTTTNVVFNAPYGAANNTSADPSIGDLFHIDSGAGAVNSITIINPTSVLPNAATAQNIYANAGNGFVEVLNTDSTLLSLGIGGNGTWKHTKLTVTGHYESESWTPTLVGWTNTGSPTVVGKLSKRGNIATFYVEVTPTTNISATKVASTITGLPFTSIVGGTAMMVDGNANSYGACIVSPAGTIYPQTSGVLTVPITIVGTLILE